MWEKIVAGVVGANFLGELSKAFSRKKKSEPLKGRAVVRSDFREGNHIEDMAEFQGVCVDAIWRKFVSTVADPYNKIGLEYVDGTVTSWREEMQQQMRDGERAYMLDDWRRWVWLTAKFRYLTADQLMQVPMDEIVRALTPGGRKKWDDLHNPQPTKETEIEATLEAKETEAKKTTKQNCYHWAPRPNHGIDLFLERSNEDSPFSKYVGNPRAISRLSRIAFPALQRKDRRCAENIALLGEASTGKTYLAKLFCDVLELPTVEINGPILKSPEDLLKAIDAELDRFDGEKGWDYSGVNLTLHASDDNEVILPPMIIVIDEVHALRRDVIEALLKATEPSDRVMDVGKYKVHTDNVLWIICTTDIGLLPKPFVSRFTKIQLKLYSKKEIAQIVHIHHPDWNWPLCHLVAHYTGRVPREALSFARDVAREFARYRPTTWDGIQAAATRVADDHEIDEHGMTIRRLNVLAALGQQGAISKSRLCHTAGCEVEELVRYIMPPILTASADEPALITVTSRGYAITPEGLKELDKRNIHHLGEEAVPTGYHAGGQ